MERSRSSFRNDIFVVEEEKNIPFNIMVYAAHNAYEIFFLLEGERRAFIGDKVYDMTAGEVMMVRPNVLHRSEGNTPYRGFCIQFTEEQLDRYYTKQAKKKLLSCFVRDIIMPDAAALAEVRLLAHHMLAEPEDIALYLPMVLAILRNAVGENKVQKGQKREIYAFDTQSISEYLMENAGHITGLEQIANHFSITKEYLCALFKKQTGTTVVTYLNNIRIQKACQLLEANNDSVEQISEKCGFQSPVYFYRLFKKVMNNTPAGYRRQVRENRSEVK